MQKTKILLSIAAFLIASYMLLQWVDGSPTWKEEVRLSDGRVIEITQKRKFYENYGTDRTWLTFSLPEMQGRQTWDGYLAPMKIDAYKGRVYVMGRPRKPKHVQYYQYPKICIVPFVWADGEFRRIPFDQAPPSLLATENVFPCVPEKKGKLTLAEKDSNWCPPTGTHNQFVRAINVNEYEKICDFYAQLDGITIRSE